MKIGLIVAGAPADFTARTVTLLSDDGPSSGSSPVAGSFEAMYDWQANAGQLLQLYDLACQDQVRPSGRTTAND